jgi:hypothetical protein
MGNITIVSGGKTLNIVSGKPVLTITPPMTLDFDYSGSNWLFTINNIDSNTTTLLNNGYKMQIQLVRFQPKGNYTRYITDTAYPNGYVNSSGRVLAKPSYPNFIGIEEIGTSTIIGMDQKARTDITDLSYESINLTSWVNNMIKYESINKRTNLQLKGISYKNSNEGYWYSRFKFIILINNTKYALTSKTLEMSYYNNGNVNQTNISNVIKTSNLIQINIGQT